MEDADGMTTGQIWRADVIRDGKRRTREEIEFLPAALEIIEMPPNPAGRKILWAIMTFFAVVIAWSLIGVIDIVAVAQGKVIPVGQTKSVQPIETSTVTAIHVAEDQLVEKGQLLIELNSVDHEADIRRLNSERSAVMNDLSRIGLLLSRLRAVADGAEPTAVGIATHSGNDLVHARVETEYQHITAQLKDIEETINQGQAEYDAIESTIDKLNRTIPLVTERAATYHKGLSSGVISRNQWLQLEQERVEQRGELKIMQKRLQSVRASNEAGRQKYKALEQQIMARLLAQKDDADIRLAALNQEITKTEAHHSLQQIRAPVSGVVQQLSVHTVGGVVTAAQQLMRIVPTNNQLEIEAYFHNRDIGFVREGQSAEVKIDAFPFTRYGTVAAYIDSLSNDAIFDEQRGLAYTARVRIDDAQMRERQFRLSPGMSVTVEAGTGTRRVIEYFLSPLLRYRDESIRER
jgi:hemolysin D